MAKFCFHLVHELGGPTVVVILGENLRPKNIWEEEEKPGLFENDLIKEVQVFQIRSDGELKYMGNIKKFTAWIWSFISKWEFRFDY